MNIAEVQKPETGNPSRRSAMHFLLLFLVPVASVFCFPFLVERSPGLRASSASYLTLPEDYAWDAHEDADIVIFGDSTAMFGPSTVRLSEITGRKAITLPGTAGTLPVIEDFALKRYLARNRAPKLIVFYFAPWNLDAFNNPSGTFWEGIEQVLRHGRQRDIVHVALAHPADMLLFPLRYYRVGNRMNRFWTQPDALASMRQGHVQLPRNLQALKGCTFPEQFLRQTGARTAKELVHRYETSETKVIVYLAPVPVCTNLADLLAVPRGAIAVNELTALPSDAFAADAFLVHPMQSTEEERTRDLAGVIERVLAR